MSQPHTDDSLCVGPGEKKVQILPETPPGREEVAAAYCPKELQVTIVAWLKPPNYLFVSIIKLSVSTYLGSRYLHEEYIKLFTFFFLGA